MDAAVATGRRSSWGLAHWLAAAAVPLLAYEAYAVVGWLADGPFQVTAERTGSGRSWTAARVIEVLVVLSVAGFVVKGVRDHRREGRLTVDALLIIGMSSAAFWDPIYNWFAPVWLYSSDWLNVNDWFAHAPGIVNPDAGQMPWPIVIVIVGYPLWGVGFAIVIDLAMRRLRRARPHLPTAALVAFGYAVAWLLTWSSFSVFQELELMGAPGFRFSLLGDSASAGAAFSGATAFWGLGLVRHFCDAEGRAAFQRGTRRPVVEVFAAVTTVQAIVVLGWGVMTAPFTLHSSPYPDLPRHLVNGLCDAPGTTGTDYGPCPGSPGFRLPMR